MMKNKMSGKISKKIVVLFGCAALMLFCHPVIAANMEKFVKISFKNISVYIGGKNVTPVDEPFMMNGKTYVPLRFVSESLGYEVKWDKNANKIEIVLPEDKAQVQQVQPEEKTAPAEKDKKDRENDKKREYLNGLNYLLDVEKNVDNAKTPTDMLKFSQAAYDGWKMELDKISSLLMMNMSEADKKNFEQMHQIWFNKNRTLAEEASSKYMGNIQSKIEYNQSLMKVTKKRTYNMVDRYFKNVKN